MKTFSKFKNLIYPIIFMPFLFTPISSLSLLINNSLNEFSSETTLLKETSTVPKGYSVEQVSMGFTHSAAVITDGTSDSLYTWGSNKHGELGLGYTSKGENYILTPQKVTFKGIEEKGLQIEQVSLGNSHSAAVINNIEGKQEDDELYMWGYNGQNQLGGGEGGKDEVSPMQLELPEGNIEQLSLGENDTAVVINNNGTDELYTWGQDTSGKLGRSFSSVSSKTPSSEPGEVLFPIEPEINYEIKEISMGPATGGAILNYSSDNTDHLFTWGSNNYGQLGLGTSGEKDPYESTPQKVSSFENNDDLKQISMGQDHSAVVVNDNSLYTWGANDKGQLGFGTTNGNHFTPKKVTTFNEEKNIQQTSLGAKSSAAIVDKELYTWGENQQGQLGIGEQGNQTSISLPTFVDFDLKVANVKQISMSKNSCIAIVNDGKHDYVYTWGANESGQLGLGYYSDNSEYKPQQVDFSFVADLSFKDHWYFYLVVIGLPIFIIGLLLFILLYIRSKRIVI